LFVQRYIQAASRLHHAIPLLHTLPLEAAVWTVWGPHAAFRQLLLEHFQADSITRRQSEPFDCREPRLALLGLRQISFGQDFLQRLVNRSTHTLLKLLDGCHP
jgi:hypothetical protein